MSGLIAALVVPLLAWGALAAGSTAFLVFVIALAAWAYLDLAAVLTRVAARPVVLVGLIPVVWLPSAIAREPARGWELIGEVFAVSLVLSFLVVLTLGRRRTVSIVVGFTVLTALLVGLGSAALVLLSQQPDGFRWVIGVAVLAAIVNAGPLAVRTAGRSWGGRRAGAAAREPAASDVAGFLAAAALVALAGLTLHLIADPPFTALVAAGVALIVLVLGVVAKELAQIVRTASAGGQRRRQLGAGAVYEATDALLVAAPAVYILARALS